MPRPIRCVVFDLDGVFRHFDPDAAAQAEERHGLPDGSLLGTGMTPELLRPLITGAVTRAEWTEEVGRRVGSPAAAREWTSDIGTPDPDVMELADELRAGGTVVAILTDGTDTVPAELAQLGIDRHIDALFNSADVGVTKPDVAAFQNVVDGLGVDASEIFFTDDSPHKLAGAEALGMTTHAYIGIGPLRAALIAADVLAR